MGKSYCCGLHPNGSMYLIAIVDIILGFVSTLLSIVALVSLNKVFGQIENDEFEDLSFPFNEDSNEQQTRSGINEFAHTHGQMIIALVLSTFFLIMAIGLVVGIRKNLDCPLKAWFIYACTITLFAGISIIILTFATGHLLWLFLTVFIFIRIYEIWVVFDFMRNSSVSGLVTSFAIGSPSTERLHNV